MRENNSKRPEEEMHFYSDDATDCAEQIMSSQTVSPEAQVIFLAQMMNDDE
jgi:hypothetical protein